jgi:DeoR/GlpR family transcriptional regulator of sugar metabolism
LAAELAREFETSEDTIRRDLRDLAAAGVCRRVYGGALKLSPASGTLLERQSLHPARKLGLGRTAAALVAPGQILLIDAGSTNLGTARSLDPDCGLTVITNAPAIAAALAGRPAHMVIMLGGRIDPRSGGSIGARALQDLRDIRADVCFLGACALSAATGISAFDAEEAAFKRVLIEASERIVVTLTNDKLGTVAPYRIAPLAAVDDIVIEADAPAAMLDGLVGPGEGTGRPRLHRAAAVAREGAGS